MKPAPLRLFAFLALFCTELLAGNLTVTLSPSQAVSSGAQWRVDGGSWRNSGATVRNLSNTTHQVEFKSVSGWLTPATQSVALTAGNTTSLTGTYVRPAALTITLTPSSAQWRIDGGAWRASGTTATGLTPDSHAIEYSSLAGYAAPAAESVTLIPNQTTTLARSYTQLAQVTVTLTPATAQWRIDGGTWRNSGTTATDLAPGIHTLEYAPVAGYITPAAETVTLAAGQSLPLTRAYVQLGQITVTLTPNTAQWRLNAGPWQPSGATLSNLPAGNYAVEYSSVPDHLAPANETIALAVGETRTVSRAYTLLAQLSIALTPSSGQWRLDGGTWQASGATHTGLTPGSYSVEYSDLFNFAKPAPESVTLASGPNSLTRSYTALASLSISLTPTHANWRIDGGSWNTTSTTLNNLATGAHLLEFQTIEGYTAPASETITLVSGPNSFSRSYTSLASLSLTLNPNHAQWRIDGGAWNSVYTTLNNLSLGTHTIDYSTIEGYITPASETITLVSGPNSRSATYTPLASLSVSLNPNHAQWRIDGGAWNSIYATLNNLPLGTHTIDYSTIEGYITPASETITLVSGPNSRSATYTPLASLSFTLNPNHAQWRLDGGSWNSVYTTLNNLSLGAHTIDYLTIEGYITPASEAITLLSGPNSRSATYTPLASLSLNLNPSQAQWRLDGGSWNSVYTTLNNLSLGTHTIDYAPVPGYDTPASETISLASGPNSLTRSYAPSGPAYAVIKTLQENGAAVSVLRGSDGRLYCVAASAGVASRGQIFRLNADGSGYTLLKAFGESDMASPSALIEASDGYLYGTSQYTSPTGDTGSLFRMTRDGAGFTVLYNFTGSETAPNSLIEASDGALYGTTARGGNDNTGVIFSVLKNGTNYRRLQSAYGARGVTEGPDGWLYAAISASNYTGTYGTLYKVTKQNFGFQILRHFNDSATGASPRAKLLLGSDGVFYGTTTAGGTANRGVVFRINADGTGYTVLHNFLGDATDGGRLDAGLVEGPDGLLYGATYSGGSSNRGTVFRLARDGSSYAVVRHFTGGATDGGLLNQTLAVATDGTLLGATTWGGGDTRGTLFRLTPDGISFTPLLQLAAPDGAWPRGVTYASDGFLYGAGNIGGGAGKGVVYKLNPNGTGFTVLYRFAATDDGAQPNSPLLEASDGRLYGVTLDGQPTPGTLFSLNKDGSSYARVHIFGSGSDGWASYGSVIEASDGMLYGTTAAGGTNGGYGTVYRVNKDGSSYAIIRSFGQNSLEGNTPACRLLEGPDGMLYGTTSTGSSHSGAVFKMARDGSNFTVLRTFVSGTTDGVGPWAGLTLASNGRLYGTTNTGGQHGKGTVYSLGLDGSGFAILKSFLGGTVEGAEPAYSSLLERDGVLYGTTFRGGTFDGGTLYSVALDGTQFQTRINFGLDSADGRGPLDTLTRSPAGVLFGTTKLGGNGGTIFRLQTN